MATPKAARLLSMISSYVKSLFLGYFLDGVAGTNCGEKFRDVSGVLYFSFKYCRH